MSVKTKILAGGCWVFLATFGSAAHAWYTDTIYATGAEHSCDAPIHAADIHQQHGYGHCGNVTPDGKESVENCEDTVRTAGGALWTGEWLVCGPGDGPSTPTGAQEGCDYMFVVRCNGTAQSHEILMNGGVNPFDVPFCGYDSSTHSWYCQNSLVGEECSCSGSSLICTSH